MKIKSLLTTLLIASSLTLTSCKEETKVDFDLKDIQTSNVCFAANIRDEQVNEIKISNETAVRDSIKATYTKKYSSSKFEIYTKNLDGNSLSLFIYTSNKLSHLRDGDLSYPNATKLDLSSSSLATSVLSETATFYGISFSTLFNVKEIDFTNLEIGNTNTFINLFSTGFHESKLEKVIFTGSNTSKITNMSGMFENTPIKDVIGLDTSKCQMMKNMFKNTTSTVINLDSSFKTTSCVSMNGMFYGSSVTSFNLDFDTSSVVDFTDMFRNAKATSINLSKFNTQNGVTFAGMFHKVSLLETLNISNFSFDKAADLSRMFYGTASKLAPEIKCNITLAKKITLDKLRFATLDDKQKNPLITPDTDIVWDNTITVGSTFPVKVTYFASLAKSEIIEFFQYTEPAK